MKKNLSRKAFYFIYYVDTFYYHYYTECRYFSELFQNKSVSTPSMFKAVLCRCSARCCVDIFLLFPTTILM